MRQNRIRYGIDKDTGLVISQSFLEHKIAIPVLDFVGMNPKNNFTTKTRLEKFDILQLAHMSVIWTRKILTEHKNIHREFWGMKPLKGKD